MCNPLSVTRKKENACLLDQWKCSPNQTDSTVIQAKGRIAKDVKKDHDSFSYKMSKFIFKSLECPQFFSLVGND